MLFFGTKELFDVRTHCPMLNCCIVTQRLSEYSGLISEFTCDDYLCYHIWITYIHDDNEWQLHTNPGLPPHVGRLVPNTIEGIGSFLSNLTMEIIES